MTDGPLTAKLLFTFDNDGLIDSVYAEARGRSVGEKIIPTHWLGHWGGYEKRNGILVPTEGNKTYWKGRIEEIEFELAD